MSNDDAEHSEANFNLFRTFLTKAMAKKTVKKSVDIKKPVQLKRKNDAAQNNPMGR